MAFSYTSGRNHYGDLINNSTGSALVIGDVIINSTIREILTERNWYFMEKTATESTVADQQFYPLPGDYSKLIGMTVAVGTTTHTLKEVPSRTYWDTLNESTFSSNIPEYFYPFAGEIGIWPIPSTGSANVITYSYKKGFRDLSIADYTTGQILTATNGSTIIVGTSTSWTPKMNGRSLRVTNSDATNTGDGVWYEISSVTNGTTLVLEREYSGPSITSGTAVYTIGELYPLPEDFHALPIYRAAEIYYSSVNPNANQVAVFKTLYQEGLERMRREYGNKTIDPTYGTQDRVMENPNNYIEL